MKKAFLFLALLMVGTVCVTMTSCGDDEPTPSGQQSESGITHEYVDLGLPSGTLWATCNIGASKPEEFGLYFAWGETVGYANDTTNTHSFWWETYKYNGSGNSVYYFTKYCTSMNYGYNGYTFFMDNLTELEPEDDAAYVNWGKKWRMASKTQFEELMNDSFTTVEKKNFGNVLGFEIKSKMPGYTDKSIFLPCGGHFKDTNLLGYNSGVELIYNGSYWSRTLNAEEPCYAYEFTIYWASIKKYISADPRCYGLAVRPVRNK